MSEITACREVGRKRPKGYCDWRPTRRIKVLIEQVEHVLVEHEDYLPLTCRQVFYILVGAFEFAKTENAYANLCEHLVRARRARMIPFDALRDDGAVVMAERWFDGPVGFWDHVGRQVRAYERDKQTGQAYYVELWCEARGMMEQLARVAHEYSVPVYSCGGFSSLTANRMIVDRILSRSAPTVMLHVGDFDPSGESIFEAMVEDVQSFLAEDALLPGVHRLIPERVALTPEQIERYEIPMAPVKGSDSRAAGWTGGTAQAEALKPPQLACEVRDAIERWIDADVLQEHVELERLERVELAGALPRGAS
ncbi:MAG TPA: hypothetical protein VNS09_16045 [Solirubrobacter sp.]|nr:hypothetical protein [Solirubrobacter sp.]